MLACPLCRIALAPHESVCPRDGQTGVEARLQPLPASLAGRFHVVEPFAVGAAGTLYLADEPETGRRGLLKVLAPAGGRLAGERQRQRRELVKQATLESGLLVAPLATGETDGQLWVFREWVEGVSLRVRLSRQGALPQDQALAIAAQLAVALDELHRAGLLHRDLKPGHVLLEPSAGGLTRVRVIDAGLCTPVDEEASVLGTPGYVAPEQLAGKLVSFRSDLYALGCVLHEMLTGRPLFAGDGPAQVLAAQRAGDPVELPDQLPESVGPLLKSLLATDAQQRPFSAQKLRRTLDAYLPDGAAVTRQPTKTFANVSDPHKAPQREPTGTLRPPAPPSGRSSQSMVAPKAASAPPPPPARASAPHQDSTQRLDIEQILEASPVKKARVSAPPPAPRRSASPNSGKLSIPPPRPSVPPRPSARPPVPPPAASGAKEPEIDVVDFAEVLDDDRFAGAEAEQAAEPIRAEATQPIRLEQILAVAAARKSAAKAKPAPAAPEPQTSAAGEPDAGAPEAQAGSVPDSRAPAAADATLDEPTLAFEKPLSSPPPEAAPGAADATVVDATMDVTLAETVEQSAALPAVKAPGLFDAPQTAAPRDVPPQDEDPDDADDEEATSVAFKPAALAMSTARPSAEAGGPNPYELPSARGANQAGLSAGAHADARSAASTTNASEARASTTISTETEDSEAGLNAGAHPLRRYVPHAAAALVLLGLGGALLSALGGDDGDTAVASLDRAAEPPPLPAAVNAAPAPSVMPLSTAPKAAAPSVAPLEKPAPQPPAASAPDPEPLAKAEPEAGGAAEPAHSKGQAAPRERSAPPERRATARERRRDKRETQATSKTAVPDTKRWAEARDAARAHYAAKRYKQAAQAYEQASKYNPNDAGTFAGLGAARLQAGDPQGAVKAYKNAVRLSPKSSGFHAALGRAYLAAGDKTRARSSYKQAVSLDPKNTAAKDALSKLGG